jgi:uncharacterized protein YbcC (UPF0753/DUF2309 family)
MTTALASPAFPAIARSDVGAAVRIALGRIPPLWPLKHFVAVNPFVGLVDQPFEQACALLQKTSGAAPLQSPADYLASWRRGEISAPDLEFAGVGDEWTPAALFTAFMRDGVARANWRHQSTGGVAETLLPALTRWQLAYEHALQRKLARELGAQPSRLPTARPRAQAIFCIDVRSEIFRRHLETAAPNFQTIGFAGFFGFPLAHKPITATAASARASPALADGDTPAALDALTAMAEGALRNMSLTKNFARLVLVCGHGSRSANNAAIIVAPRRRTRALALEGRVFLHDYDASADPDLKVLDLILNAPVVVASWINLQYYASRVDPARYGSGDKVLHQVAGGLGVFEGNGGDLRVGLPLQSIHDGEKFVHEPRRLSVFIEATRGNLDTILARHAGVRQLFENGWIHLFALEAAACFRRSPGGAWTAAA